MLVKDYQFNAFFLLRLIMIPNTSITTLTMTGVQLA